ncbi:MAG: hypothetical protein SOU50_03395 [Oscillospiraceae bacterium]|nr:hypothetical protein [Oscillospiraceae bacterium]MDY2847244.1 hypothetical protein [Oscillospiraceae bacterium]
MTQTVSKRSSSAAVHYGLTLAKRNMKYGVLELCMSLLGLPLILSVMLAECSSTQQNYDYVLDYVDDIYLIIAEISAVIGLIMGIYTAKGSFAHLYDRRLSDMEYSLPLTASKRFMAGYFSGLAVYILPYIIAQLISSILLAIGMNAVDAQRETKLFASFIPYFNTVIAGGLIVMVMFYTLFVLTMTFCGSKFETSIFAAAANLCLPVIYVCIYMITDRYGYGLVSGISDDTPLNRIFSCTSPIGALYKMYFLMNIDPLYDYSQLPKTFFSMYSMGGWAVGCLLLTAVLFVCAILLYRRRKAEQTGETFIYKPFYYVVMFCITAAVCLLMDYLGTGIVPMIIVTMALFVIIDCVINKGIKKLLRAFVKYAAVMAGVAAVYFVSVKAMNVFVINYVPEVSEIEYAEVMGYDRCLVGNGDYVGTFHFEDEENIRRITELHSEQLSLHDDHEVAVLPAKWFGIKYTYKNGRTAERHYYEPVSSVYEELTKLEYTEEVKKQKTAALENTLNTYDYTIVIGNGTAGELLRLEHEENKDIFTDEFTSGLSDCLTEDIAAMTFEDIEDNDENALYVDIYADYMSNDTYIGSGPVYSGYKITEAYKKTMAYLDSHGIMPRTDMN